jgi:hypothetical protein
MKQAKKVVALGLALLAAACGDAPTSAPLAAPAIPQQDLQVVARSVAMAMQNDAVRLSVRDALRDSPWSEHKITLQEFLASPAGPALASAAAAASGEGAEVFGARIARLPELDFYVPSREQRLSWRGTADVTVAATLDLEASTVGGFTAEGRSIADATRTTAGAVLLLAPTELRTKRIQPQPAGIGETIQARDDGEQSQTLYTWIAADGTRTTAIYEELVSGQDTRLKPVFNHSGGAGTLVQEIAGYMNDGSSSNLELGVRAGFYAPDGTYVGTAEWKKTGIPKNTTVTIGEVLFASHVIPDNGNGRIWAQLWEMDNCGNFDHYSCGTKDDDPYGATNYYYNDRDVTKSISCPSGYSVCSLNELTGNLKLHWHARSASTFNSVRLFDEQVREGYSKSVSAQAVDQYGYGIPGYSVSSWSTGDSFVATITNASGNTATLNGIEDGWTTYSATINGVTATANVEVLCVEGRNGMVCPI